MIISYGRPADISATMNGGDAAFIDSASFLFDGRPGQVSAFTWRTGAQTTSTKVNIDTLWATAIVPRVVGLFGLTLPVGTLITALGKRVGDSGYPYSLGTPSAVRVQELPNGERVAWIILPEGLTACIGIRFEIANDVNGSASIVAGSELRVGECWVGSGLYLCVQPGLSVQYEDATSFPDSEDLQPFAQRKTPRRVLSFTPATRSLEAVVGSASYSSIYFEQLWAKINRGQQAVFVPFWQDDAGVYDAYLVNHSAVFGSAVKNPSSRHLLGRWSELSEIQVREAPVPT